MQTRILKPFTFHRFKKAEGGATKKAKHPKLIVSKKKDEYGYMGLTSSEKRGHHKNIKLHKNPQRGNMKPSYLRKEVRYGKENLFGERLSNYKLHPKDKKTVKEFLRNKKK